MNTKQIILLVITTIVVVLAIWNLVLYIQIECLGMSKRGNKDGKKSRIMGKNK